MRVYKMFGGAAVATAVLLGPVNGAVAQTTVALVLPGPISDGGWNQRAYEGLMELEQFGDFSVSYVENVADAENPATIRSLADDGTDLIIGHGFQFGGVFVDLADDYPDVAFFASTGAPANAVVPDNVLFVDFGYDDSGLAAGALAALLSETGVVGMVGGGDNANTHVQASSFAAAARATDADIDVLTHITGAWNDAALGREAATTMVGNGADVIWHTADLTGVGAIEGAVAGDARVIGMFADQTDLAPENVVTSLALNNAGLVHSVGVMVNQNLFVGGTTWEPDFSFIWVPTYGDAAYNVDLITASDWAAFQEVWSAIENGSFVASEQ